MKDFTLSQQYAILGLDGIESLHSSFAKNAVIRGIFVARELEKIFDQAGIDCLEVEMGMLVRRKRETGYEWIIEI